MSDLISKRELYRKIAETYNSGRLSWGANEIFKDIIGECDSVENKGEPCDDCISRKDAIQALKADGLEGLCRSLGVYPWNVIKMLPSIQPTVNVSENPNKWIPVSERLPKIAGVYRVTRYYPNSVMHPRYLVDACFFDGSNTWYNDNRINHERAYVDNVIAWQENPEPYKTERGEE